MTDFEIAAIKRQWEAGVSIQKIVKTMPHTKVAAMRMIWRLQDEGVLPARKRKRGAELVVEAYKNGMHNPYEIAEQYNYSVYTVRRWLNDAKLERGRPPHNWKQKELDAKTKKIIECLESGVGVCETARRFGVTKQWVSQVKKRSEENERRNGH
jgi:DNA invertase Pin-like site-specific DNA recombinase